MVSSCFSWLSFYLPCEIYLFPVASSRFQLMSLPATLSSPPASLSPCASCPSGFTSPVFLQEFRARGQGESSSAKCLQSCLPCQQGQALFLSYFPDPKFQHHCPPFYLKATLESLQSASSGTSCVSMCVICMLVWMGSPKALLLPRNN